ncbi:MAG: HD domain-containing protein [Magnetococcales bacterium]|nr:HD domain-containing protein [Magnetococcales bacterium]
MARLSRFSLTQKVLFWSFLGFMINIHLLVMVSESQLERAMLDQVYKQAQSYLFGLAQHMESMPANATTEQYRRVLLTGLSREGHPYFQFTPNEIYLYAADGRILGHTEPGEHPDKPLDGVYGQVIREGRSIISSDLPTAIENRAFDSHPTIDVILPVRLGGNPQVNAGLEAELDMAELMRQIKVNDDAYEKRIVLLTLASGILLFLFIWWLLHRLAIRHVTRFSQVMSAFGSGTLEARIPLPLPSDEIGALGRSINGMADNLCQLMREQEEGYLQTLQSLSKALEAKDAYTQSHSARVSRYAVMLGKHLGLPEATLKVLNKGALMHDLGKIGVPDAILNKPAPLTDDEFVIMRSHARYTATIMRPLHRFHEFLEIAAWHHEHWDGSGYPDGLAGEKIPLLARIVSIADTWDAMTGDRVYRKGMSHEKALGILEREQDAGQWDPHLVRRFIALIREKEGVWNPE